MNKKTNVEKLIEVAAKYGYSEEQIILICDEIGRAAYEQFAQELERLLTPDEKHMVENIQNEDQADAEIKRLYTEKTGEDAQLVVNGYLARHIEEFIQDHEQGSSSSAL